MNQDQLFRRIGIVVLSCFLYFSSFSSVCDESILHSWTNAFTKRILNCVANVLFSTLANIKTPCSDMHMDLYLSV